MRRREFAKNAQDRFEIRVFHYGARLQLLRDVFQQYSGTREEVVEMLFSKRSREGATRQC